MADLLAVCEACKSVYAAYRDDDDKLYLKGAGKQCFECGSTDLRALTADSVGPAEDAERNRDA